MKARQAKKICRLHPWNVLRYRMGTLQKAIRIIDRLYVRHADVARACFGYELRWGKWDPHAPGFWTARELRRDRRRQLQRKY